MTDEPRQLILDLQHRAALGAEDFIISSANAAAIDLVDRWPGWVSRSALVVGPARSGKTHLGHVWQLKSGAVAVQAAALDETAVDLLHRHKALLIEDVDRGISDERVLFHLLNIAREDSVSLLLTSSVAAGELAITLPDLRSRLRALPFAAIAEPDEDLLRVILVKLFADRQLAVEPHVVAHIARHMTRSMALAGQIVDEIDRQSLADRRKVTRNLAADVLARLMEREIDFG
jgi:chromosomal replication initiation ATPase DnaA